MPRNDVDISSYESALDYAFYSPEKIQNIALSGSYGSGKSSIIETLLCKNLFIFSSPPLYIYYFILYFFYLQEKF